MDIEKVREFKAELIGLINAAEKKHGMTMRHIAFIGHRVEGGQKITDDLDIVFVPAVKKQPAAEKKTGRRRSAKTDDSPGD